jgi:GT2 family glycosyltransferase
MLQHAHVSCVGPRIVLPLTAERQPKAFGYQPALKNVLMQSLGLNKIFARCDFFNGIDGEYRDQAQMQVGWLSGVCMMMRKADYLAVGGFDARFFMYCEDIDLCMKLSRLGRIVFVDDYPVMHYGGASTKSLGSKIRNSVWQQQNLLTIIRDYYGQFVAVIARAILGIGMCIRLAIAVLMIPKRGITHHEALSIAWARLLDLLGWHSSRGVT